VSSAVGAGLDESGPRDRPLGFCYERVREFVESSQGPGFVSVVSERQVSDVVLWEGGLQPRRPVFNQGPSTGLLCHLPFVSGIRVPQGGSRRAAPLAQRHTLRRLRGCA